MKANALLNEPCFIIANGPSATDEDLTQLHNHFTIGINRAFLALDPVVLFWLDSHFSYQEANRIRASKAIKVCRDIADSQRLHQHHYRLDCDSEFKLPTTPAKLFGKGATGPLAVQFAYALGCDPIVLIGFDCCYRGTQTDFYGINKNHSRDTLKNCRKGLQWVSGIHQRTIINCSANDVFAKRQSISDVLAAIGEGKGKEYYRNVLTASIDKPI